MAMKTVTYKAPALKALRKIPAKDSAALGAKVESYASGIRQDVVPIVGSTAKRLRHGDWRVIFDETETEIVVLAIRHRREAYR
jgi:mRNA interferase RelE/StbE